MLSKWPCQLVPGGAVSGWERENVGAGVEGSQGWAQRALEG